MFGDGAMFMDEIVGLRGGKQRFGGAWQSQPASQ